MIIIPTKLLFHWGYTPFSDIPEYVQVCKPPLSGESTVPCEGHLVNSSSEAKVLDIVTKRSARASFPMRKRPGWRNGKGSELQQVYWIYDIAAVYLSLRIHGAGILTYIGIIWKITLGVNVGKCSIHGSSGYFNPFKRKKNHLYNLQ